MKMTKRSFRCFVEQELGKFPHFLLYAALEWVLIILLFIDGFLAFVANEFAKFFELRIPCLLCTRIDHVLVHRNPDFYYNESICECHKKDVSSLAYCHVHKKVSDIRKMCEACLLSFATEKSSDCDTYKSLVGILHKDLELLVDDDYEVQLTLPCGKKDEMVQTENCCSCCGEPLKVKSHAKAKNSNLTSLAPTPSPRVSFLGSRNDETRNLELPHIRYTELKFMSYNETEVPEDEDGSNSLSLHKQFREDVKVPLLTDAEDMNEDNKTPNFVRGNRFFGIPLTDSAQNSPRWTTRLPKKLTLEKVEDARESVEGQGQNEADGDSIFYHLKRQVRLDRKSLLDLYMELDEERSASAVAANNAMAMITRLQADKAAVQMEALQYQRMMEEQAEYDQEALQATKDLLAKREEEIKEIEAELEIYREKYGCLDEDEIQARRDLTGEDYEFKSQSCSPNDRNLPGSSTEVSNDDDNSVKSDDQAGSSQDKNWEEPEDKSQKSEHLDDHLKIPDKKVHFSPNDVVPSSQSGSDNVNDKEKDSKEVEL
ncbi:hypothetical protein ACOSP7_024311 [Xanthoceras sorbifolium]|uniref:GTD-binding domain-containing protein n=1 Tax=Xanthoceras sorbifolium TaxID=99658 RepID=A0ABQ8H8Z3_9ROSI|nr:hypothetical protein JRO89_XS13G0184400 [Xanthoceras sorbifolium]